MTHHFLGLINCKFLLVFLINFVKVSNPFYLYFNNASSLLFVFLLALLLNVLQGILSFSNGLIF